MVESNNANSEKKMCIDDDEKSRTFRKRRLTCVKHHLAAEDNNDNDSNNNRLEQNEQQVTSPSLSSSSLPSSSPFKKCKPSSSSQDQHFPSRIIHAGQLHPPCSPNNKNNHHRLYDEPFQHEPIETEEDRASKPAWRHRHVFHHFEDNKDYDHKLPFPRHVVGTYSCHGIEPVYESEYEDEDDDDDEEEWAAVASSNTNNNAKKEETLTDNNNNNNNKHTQHRFCSQNEKAIRHQTENRNKNIACL